MRSAPAGALFLLLGLGSVGVAADDDSILVADDFSTFNSAWGWPSDTAWVEANKLIMQPEPQTTFVKFYDQLQVGDVDIRVKICLAEGGTDGAAGIVFWADFNNSYAAIVAPDGYVGVVRRIKDQPFDVAPGKIQAAMKQGIGQANELRVATRGKWAAVYVNGEKICTFRGFPPADTSLFGLRAGSGDRPYRWQFSELTVRKTEPSLLPATPAVTDSSLVYADDFSIFDAGWGEAGDKMFVAENKMIVKPGVDSGHLQLYAGTQFTDADIRVKLRASDGAPDQPAGIVFWAADIANFYLALLQPNGYVAVLQRAQGERLTVVPWNLQPAVIQDVGRTNELRVVTKGEWAAIYVNDQEVCTFQGSPPDAPCMIGLVGNSGSDPPSTWEFTDLVVRKPEASLLRDTVLYAADFSRPDSAWGETDDSHYFENNDFVFRPDPDASYTQLYGYEEVGFRDVDVRVMVYEVEGRGDKGAGIVFWATDFMNCYVAMLMPDGRVGVSRNMQGKWLNPGPWTVEPAVKQGTNQWNELRVVTRGRWAAIYVNDQPICKFQGFPPDGYSYVGLHANSGADVYTWAFANFVVRKPDESLLPASTSRGAKDPTVLFADDFQRLDLTWGKADGQLRTEGNGLVIESAADRAYTPLYLGSLFGDCDVRVKVSQTRGGADKAAGIAFWGVDYDDYYVAHLRSDGRCGVWRKESGTWQTAVEARVVNAVKQGLDQENELRVVTQGETATVYINGAQVARFNGDPPEGGGLVGLHGESGSTPYVWRFSNFSVRKLQ